MMKRLMKSGKGSRASDICDPCMKNAYSILMVAACPFPANHGSPASIREMSETLSLLGHSVHVVTYPMGHDIPVGNITIHRVGMAFSKKKVTVGPTYYKLLLDLFLVIKACKLIKHEGIDIIHAHNYEGAIVGYIAKKITGKPMLYNAVNNMISELPMYNFIKPKKLAVIISNLLDYLVPRAGDHITAVSEDLYKFLVNKGIPSNRITIVPAGVNLEMFENKDPDLMRARYNIGKRPLIVYTGTLDIFQRIDLLLKAMRIVIDNIPNAVLLIVGNIINTSDLAQHKKLAAEIGLDKNVIFTDEVPLEEIPYFLASADVAVLSRPYCPGFPVKLLNYMAAGKAIVTFEGSAKGLKNMFNAIVIKNNDWEEFGKGIIKPLLDRRLAIELGENARKTIHGNYDWPSLTKKIEKIYKLLKNEV